MCDACGRDVGKWALPVDRLWRGGGPWGVGRGLRGAGVSGRTCPFVPWGGTNGEAGGGIGPMAEAPVALVRN